MFMNCCNTSLADFFDRPGSNLLYDHEASLSLNECNDTMMAITTDYRIAFPMPNR